MAKRISELDPASSVADTDEFELNQSGTSRRATKEQLFSAIASPISINGRTLADADNGKQFRCTGTGAVVIPSSLTNGFVCLIINRAGGAVSITGSGLTPDGDAAVGDDHFATISKDAATSALVRATG